MNQQKLRDLLKQVSDNKITVEEALHRIKTEPYKELDFAKIDTMRGIRQGIPEVIYGEGKTREQIEQIINNSDEELILVTRLDRDKAKYLTEKITQHLLLTEFRQKVF